MLLILWVKIPNPHSLTEINMKVKISEIEALVQRMSEINKPELDEMQFLDDNGNELDIDKNIIEQFQFYGLNNIDFITTGFYKNKK